jgi:mannose-6-phosphate isomerase-like protein (cupin superfamily)
MPKSGLEVFRWDEVGYRPLVCSAGWQVALLNWEPPFDDLARLGEIERHNQSDEVFVLLKGRSVLFTLAEDGLTAVDMAPGVVYNVTAGSWHNLIATRDATWLIVENRETDLHDVEFRQMTAEEKQNLLGRLPDWTQTLDGKTV